MEIEIWFWLDSFVLDLLLPSQQIYHMEPACQNETEIRLPAN